MSNWHADIDYPEDVCDEWRTRALAAEAERDRLREALEWARAPREHTDDCSCPICAALNERSEGE